MDTTHITDDWPIYNCHIHMFTRRHSPRWFIKWVLSDADLGRINWVMVPVYLLLAALYFGLLVGLAGLAIFLSTRSDLLSRLGYSFVLFFQAALVIPIVLLIFILAALGVIFLLQVLLDLLIKLRSVSPSRQVDSRLMQVRRQVTEGRSRMIRSNLLINLLVRVNPASNDLLERMARFLKIAEQPSQREIFKQVQLQYPEKTTVFVVQEHGGWGFNLIE
jgi:hypothetical protein